jgi:LmbE family N-acetylglucosaminyl deacetylase
LKLTEIKRKYLVIGILALVVVILIALAWSVAEYARETSYFKSHSVTMQNPGRRVLVLAPHPDDETFGTGGVIRRALQNHAAVRVVVVTSGNHFIRAARLLTGKKQVGPDDLAYLARVRQGESRQALKILGATESQVTFLGYPDRGLTPLLTGRSPGHIDLKGFTRAGLESELKLIIKDFQPTDIYYPASEDDHPDHTALGILTQDLLGRQHVRQHLYLVHYKQNQWPSFTWLSQYVPLMPPLNLTRNGWVWENMPLSGQEYRAKWQAALAYKSQLKAVGGRYLTYARHNEIFLVPKGQ